MLYDIIIYIICGKCILENFFTIGIVGTTDEVV